MTAYILDSSALLRYIDNELGADRVESILSECISGRSEARISAVQWGEIAGKLRAHHGAQQQRRILSSLPTEIEIVSATVDRAVHAAELKVDRKIAYADAFALDLAMQSADHVLVTADYGFKSVADLARIEFLPAK
jgi:PIN domain nuclease of toxin-antitoxin system